LVFVGFCREFCGFCVGCFVGIVALGLDGMVSCLENFFSVGGGSVGVFFLWYLVGLRVLRSRLFGGVWGVGWIFFGVR